MLHVQGKTFSQAHQEGAQKDIRVVGGTPDNDLAVGNTYDCLHAADWGWPKL